ncbi:RICIN domain-containing protein [Streptomyces flaveus]|uniref:RICIN domain-containing protein n=1 Tax=Streptomyces flaveus TaxID=66370 RepID=UPI003333B205
MRFRRLASVLATVVVGTAVGVVTNAESAHASGPWEIYTYTRGPGSDGALDGCVGVQEPVEENSSPIEQDRCGIGNEWDMLEIDPGLWQIQFGVGAGKCMNVKGASTLNSAAVIQYTCSYSASNNLWHLDKVTNVGGLDWYRIRNQRSDKCLNVPQASTAFDINLIQYTCGAARRNDLFTWGPA